MNFEQIKADLLHKATIDGLVKEGADKRITPSMDDIPVKRMIDQVNYIDKELLPAIKKKSGDKSADYEFFSSVIKSLLHSIVVVDRWETLNRRWIHQLIELKLCREHLLILETELRKYHAMEDIYLVDGLRLYAERIKKHADDLLKGETKPK
jgi:hypothetical protein